MTTTATFGEARTKTEKRRDERVLTRVKRGIALLEEEFGHDWVDRINLETLNLGDSAACVLGQLYGGDYARGTAALGITNAGAVYGFDREKHEGSAEYGDLTQIWRELLTPTVTTS